MARVPMSPTPFPRIRTAILFALLGGVPAAWTALQARQSAPRASDRVAVGSERVADWAADIDELYETIVAKHPDPFWRRSETDFRAELDRIRDSVPARPDHSTATRLIQTVASLGDGHTQLRAGFDVGFERWFPVRFYEFTDGIFITAVDEHYPELAGAKVERIGSLSADEAARRARTLWAHENDFWRMEGLFYLSSAPALATVGVIDDLDALPLELVLRDGTTRQLELPAYDYHPGISWVQWGEMFGPHLPDDRSLVTAIDGLAPMDYRDEDPTRPPHLRYRLRYKDFWPLEDGRTAYVQINFWIDRDEEPFEEFTERLFAHLDSIEDSRLVLDIRYNGGGDGTMALPFTHELIKRAGGLNSPDRLFVLVGRKSFSASVLFLSTLLDHTYATFVGEPAGAAIDMYGDATTSELANTGMSLSVSTVHWALSMTPRIRGTLEWGDPRRPFPIHYPARFSSEDYFSGRDPALDAIMSGEAGRSIVSILCDTGGEAARRVYEERKARFDDPDWWEPFGRRDMRKLGESLLESGSVEDALVAFHLNTERFPESWRVWDSLGEGYRVAGERGQALAAFRRAIDVSPDNWNGEYQRRMVDSLAALAGPGRRGAP